MPKELIKWIEAYSVGIEIIDNQHKELIRLINKLYNLYLNKETDNVFEIISALQDYTNYHFKTEEKLFKEKNYPKAAEHIKIHNEFITEVNKLAEEYKNNSNVLSIKAMTLLQRWLTNHILVEDKKYIKYLT